MLAKPKLRACSWRGPRVATARPSTSSSGGTESGSSPSRCTFRGRRATATSARTCSCARTTRSTSSRVRSELFTWLYRLAVNRALDARRGRARRSESSIDETDPRIERALEVDAKGDPRRVAELRQTYACLLRALDALPAEMRTTVVLVELQGLSNAEAAVVQGCPRGTIAWRLHTARASAPPPPHGDAPVGARFQRKDNVVSPDHPCLTSAGLPTLEPT